MQGSEIAAYTGIGAIGLLTIVKGLSALIRTWNGDRKDDKADKSVGNQIGVLERENKDLREENNRLRDDWKRLAKEEAALSARIQGLFQAQIIDRTTSDNIGDFCSEWCLAALGLPNAAGYRVGQVKEIVEWANSLVEK